MARRRPVRRGDISLDKWTNWLKNLRNASGNKMIVCQHKKAYDVLKALGCKNVTYVTEPEYDFIQKLIDFGKECLLLFDTDRNSNVKCQKLRSKLEHRGIKVSTRFRKVFFTAQSKSISGLLKYLHRVIGSERVHRSAPV